MTPIQIPDLLVPDDAVRALGHRIVGPLTKVLQWLRQRRGENADKGTQGMRSGLLPVLSGPPCHADHLVK